MHIANNPETLIKLIGNRPVRLALGNFDGVHLGHRRLIRGLVDRANAHDESSIVVTFNPHPAQYFGRNGGFKKIDTSVIQRRYLAALGVSGLLELHFDSELAAMSGEDFISRILGAFKLREIAVGEDFRFGHSRSGDVSLLKTWGHRKGFDITVMETVEINGSPASSSRVRLLLSQYGDVALASKVLGRPYSLVGQVVKGQQLGRTLGFPTANLSGICQVLPKNGVYSGKLLVLSRLSSEIRPQDLLPCVINIGVRPTVGDDGSEAVQVEAHVYDPKLAHLDLYGENVELQFEKRLRDERRFESLEALKRQILQDIEAAES